MANFEVLNVESSQYGSYDRRLSSWPTKEERSIAWNYLKTEAKKKLYKTKDQVADLLENKEYLRNIQRSLDLVHVSAPS